MTILCLIPAMLVAFVVASLLASVETSEPTACVNGNASACAGNNTGEERNGNDAASTAMFPVLVVVLFGAIVAERNRKQ